MRTKLTILSIFITSVVFAQDVRRCGTVEAVQFRNEQNPGYKQAVEATFNAAKIHASQKAASEPAPIYRIPVVVHIVYNTPEENISDDLVHAQIARLNKDYRRLNEDTADTRSEFLPVAADAGIEFYLAGEDPQGNPTGGITRTQTSRSDFAPDFFGTGMDDVKQSSMEGVDSWDTDNYLNIWVCDLAGTNPLFQIFGFAYPPAGAPNWPANNGAPSSELEGVVVHYEVFGDGNPLAVGTMSVSDKGRTAVHEVGHYLGLRHIWGDVLFGDGCAEDDGIDDTPNASANAAQQCNFSNNTCVDGGSVDFPDMIENYMDYAQDRCMNLFTQGQVDIMRSMLETARTELADESVEPSSIQDFLDESEVGLFPNPSNGNFQIQLPANHDCLAIRVIDLSGRQISAINKNLSGQLITVNTSVSPGVYLLQLDFEEGMLNKRFSVY